MGFRKTEKGNVIYDFDFTPTKLVPLAFEDCGYDRCYAVEGPNGERAPVIFEFQGERYKNYTIAFGFALGSKEYDMCVCANIPLIATFAKLFNDSEPEDSTFDPWATTFLAKQRMSFDIMPMNEALSYLRKISAPTEGYDILKEKMK